MENTMSTAHYKGNEQYYKDNAKKWRKANPERYRELTRISYLRHPEKGLLRNAVLRARKKNLELSITLADIKIPERCPYLGIVLKQVRRKERHLGCSPTIDRINPSKGYTPDNIEVISDLANRMKQNATPGQLVDFAEYIIKRYKSKV